MILEAFQKRVRWFLSVGECLRNVSPNQRGTFLGPFSLFLVMQRFRSQRFLFDSAIMRI